LDGSRDDGRCSDARWCDSLQLGYPLHDRRSMGGMAVVMVVIVSLSLAVWYLVSGIVGDMAAQGRGDRPSTRKERTVHQGIREAAGRPACVGCNCGHAGKTAKKQMCSLVHGASRVGGAEI
jgi:hypothetical protein